MRTLLHAHVASFSCSFFFGRTFSSNDGELIATGGSAGVLRVWRFDSSKCIVAIVAHSGIINSVAFTPDDRQILTAGDDGCINVWCVYNDDA